MKARCLPFMSPVFSGAAGGRSEIQESCHPPETQAPEVRKRVLRGVMKIHLPNPQIFEFSFPQFDTLLRVEALDSQIVIRATRDSFSEQRKLSFIRELASEGFIRDELRWFSDERLRADPGILWVVDYSWLSLNPRLLARSRRFMIGFISVALLGWLAMMAFLFWHGAG